MRARTTFMTIEIGLMPRSLVSSVPQPKVRLMSEKFSAELRYLMTLGTPEAEKKVGAYFAYKNMFRRGDEIGISYSQTWANQAGNELDRGPEVFVFYGIRE